MDTQKTGEPVIQPYTSNKHPIRTAWVMWTQRKKTHGVRGDVVQLTSGPDRRSDSHKPSLDLVSVQRNSDTRTASRTCDAQCWMAKSIRTVRSGHLGAFWCTAWELPQPWGCRWDLIFCVGEIVGFIAQKQCYNPLIQTH